MNNYSREEKDFLEGVWSKTRYLEYLHNEQELTRDNAKRLAAAKLKLALTLLAAIIITALPILLLYGLGLSSVMTVGLLLLGAGALYEYFTEKEMNRRATYGNKY